MSELIQKHDNHAAIRWKLLTSASALALAVSFVAAARAEDADRPTIWIELGGQLNRLETSQQAFAPPFFSAAPPGVLAPMIGVQKLPIYDIGENGKITFEPTGSNWLFSASLRYGRASSTKHLHYETARQTVPITLFGQSHPGIRHNKFGDGQGGTQETNLLLDFQAGKDLGLGLFGAKGNSVVSAGVRFAQFTSGSEVTLHALPTYASDVTVRPGKYTTRYNHFHTNTAIIQSRRSTHALGPKVSWDASLPFAGNSESMSMAFDWGINAAILFGRQRAQIHHQTAGYYHKGPAIRVGGYHSTYVNPPVDRNRSRNVMIPNVGGFAGISFRYTDAKVSFGYRGDFFFNAVDTGWDTRKSSNLGFYGPFASLSVGIGD